MPLPFPLNASVDEVRGALAPLRNDFAVALHSCQNAFAVGAIIRVAHSFLAREIIVIGDEPHYAKASMGMEKYESVVRLADDSAFFEYAAGRPVWALEKDRAEQSITSIKRFPAGVVFVMGSERAGLSSAFLDRSDAVVGIPIYGVNHSLPVAVAAGIVMHEWARRRYANANAF
jgi:tRNA G18 (ribose-2'-O)-methylase SpoU